MQVEVGGTGLLGFCDASFTEQRTNIGRHWLNEHNWNRTWVLHSAGYFANGNVRDANVKNANAVSALQGAAHGGHPTCVEALLVVSATLIVKLSMILGYSSR